MRYSASTTPRFHGAPVDLVVDVRSRLEYWTGHLPGAVCVPVADLPQGIAGRRNISATSRILVYCASGKRSADAVALLRAAGFSNVVDGGGIGDVRRDFTP